jgi:hypothetical protein
VIVVDFLIFQFNTLQQRAGEETVLKTRQACSNSIVEAILPNGVESLLGLKDQKAQQERSETVAVRPQQNSLE